jgi:hypothetical protein
MCGIESRVVFLSLYVLVQEHAQTGLVPLRLPVLYLLPFIPAALLDNTHKPTMNPLISQVSNVGPGA